MKYSDLNKWTTNDKLSAWIKEIVKLCQPSDIHLCDGSEEEFQKIISSLEAQKKVVKLNPQKRPNSYYFRSHPDDVARVEEATFICTLKKEDCGPTNNWKDPLKMKEELLSLFSGCMEGRTLYVIPFSMGPIGSDKSLIGVQITDSEYVVCNMKIMTRMGKEALTVLKNSDFIPCLHSVGVPLKKGEKDLLWPCNPEKRCIVHFPHEPSIYSFGSGYGGNALLGKKCLALRIASYMAKEKGWMAEHMLILSITSPEGKKKYFAAAFPSACGKTNLAMMQPTLPEWKVECIGDDIAWMKFSSDGKLYAINPEAGFFGVAPSTSKRTNPFAMQTLFKDSIFTNVGLTDDGDIWWEGIDDCCYNFLTSWLGERINSLEKGKNVAHANSRFTTPIKNCPVFAKEWNDPKGVPISAIIFGGRREDTVPLVFESLDWDHGVFLGASISSQMTAAAKGVIGKLRHDPFAMLPFCGYNMADYFDHWFSIKERSTKEKLPKIFYVNWFMKDEKGNFIWPGFGENIRVLKWIFERLEGKSQGAITPIGILPKIDELDISGLSLSPKNLLKLLEVDISLWEKEAKEIEDYFSIFGERLPLKLIKQIKNLKYRLEKSKLCVHLSKE